MSTIIRATTKVTDIGSGGDMQLLVNSYWGSAENEKMFILPFWKIKQLLAASSVEEIALKVTDIENTGFVDAEWVVLEENADDTLKDPFKPNDRYYVLNESTFEYIRKAAATLEPVYKCALFARLGKETIDNATSYYAFFNTAVIQLITIGGGGNGASTGFKLPPGH